MLEKSPESAARLCVFTRQWQGGCLHVHLSSPGAQVRGHDISRGNDSGILL